MPRQMMVNFNVDLRPARSRLAVDRALLSVCLAIACVTGAAAVEMDSLIDRDDPQYPADPEPIVSFSPRLAPLWLQALSRRELDLRLQAAEAITLAHQGGMPDLEQCVPALTDSLEAGDSDSLVKQAAARALIQLDARQTAPILMKHATSGDFDLARVVEPALARWGYQAIEPQWLKRLEDRKTPRKWLLLAVVGVVQRQLEAAAQPLRHLLHDPAVRPDLRLEVARALHSLQVPGLVDDARQLTAGSDEMIDRLLAATILQSQTGSDAETLLQGLAGDEEPAVAVIAMRSLMKIDPKRVQSVWTKVVSSNDPQLRELAIETLLSLRTPQAVANIGRMLDDPHPQVRRRAQEALVELDEVETLSAAVRQAAMQMLQSDNPNALEQAILVVGAVEHDPAAQRLVELLEHEQPKVFVTAAWALRRVAVPETAAAMLEKAERQTQATLVRLPLDTHVDMVRMQGIYDQIGHLIEALTVLEHEAADPLFRQFMPNPPPPAIPPVELIFDAVYQPPLRVRAIRGLGYLHAGEPEEALVNNLHAVLTADPTGQAVRGAIVLALARMDAQSVIPTLRGLYESRAPYDLGHASRWALEKLTGESLPELQFEPQTVWRTGWFLEPLDSP